MIDTRKVDKFVSKGPEQYPILPDNDKGNGWRERWSLHLTRRRKPTWRALALMLARARPFSSNARNAPLAKDPKKGEQLSTLQKERTFPACTTTINNRTLHIARLAF